jgi:hypothetical protein
MKVSRAIELLQKTYEPDDELMIDWVDKYQASVDTDEQWNWAVGMMEGSSEGMIDMYYVQDMVSEAIADLEAYEVVTQIDKAKEN